MLGGEIYQIQSCNQLVISGLDTSQHRFSQKVFRNCFINGMSVLTLDDMLKNETLMLDISASFIAECFHFSGNTQ